MGQRARQMLRVAATPLVSSHLLPQVLARLRDSHPDVTVQLIDTSLENVQTLVESGGADVGLGFFFRSAHGLVRRQVAEFPLMRLMAAPQPPVALGRTSWSTLRNLPLISLPGDNPIQRVIDAQLDRLGAPPPSVTAVSFLATQISMVEAGFGAAVVPTFAVAACRRHRVRMDLLGQHQVRIGFYRISRRGGADTEAGAAFDATLMHLLPLMSR